MSEHTPEPWLAEFEELVHGTHSMKCEAVERYAKLRAEREELRELLWWVEAKLQPELNVSNYHHQQVCELNANATEAVLAIRAALAEKGD